MSEEQNDLLPCPFCGGEASLHKYATGHDVPIVSWLATCGRCLAHAPHGPSEDPTLAIAAWNRRATPPSVWNDAVEACARAARKAMRGYRPAGTPDDLWPDPVTAIRALLRPEQPRNDMPPARKALRAYAVASKSTPCPICGGTESCDHTVRERLLAALSSRTGGKA